VELFEREDLDRLLRLLAQRLDAAGVSGTISLVGGAAISLQYLFDRDSTTDIDALLPQSPIVAQIIHEIAVQENLDSGWINDAVKAYVPFETIDMWVDIFAIGGIVIRVASAELLLAMKLNADRGLRDRGDIEGLLGLIGVHSLEEVKEIFEKYHHQEILKESTCLMVEQILSNA
jgi:hypothetical protein